MEIHSLTISSVWFSCWSLNCAQLFLQIYHICTLLIATYMSLPSIQIETEKAPRAAAELSHAPPGLRWPQRGAESPKGSAQHGEQEWGHCFILWLDLGMGSVLTAQRSEEDSAAPFPKANLKWVRQSPSLPKAHWPWRQNTQKLTSPAWTACLKAVIISPTFNDRCIMFK